MNPIPPSRHDVKSPDLEQVSRQLLQSEKMAAIGQLAAGVAHEINNPIGYVASNLRTLVGYVEVMLKIIDQTEQTDSMSELRAVKKRLEYGYIREDVLALMAESEEGIERVKGIIAALRDFSHIDEETFIAADLHHCLDTTLQLMNNELKYRAQVIKAYGKLPPVACMPSQINQVVLNLLTNAVHTLGGDGCITLRTGLAGELAWFEIEDNGKGIPEEHLPRLFEPFFTTKPVGEGTGLGLALSYRIVEKHRGRIEVESQTGQGSRFRVWLPLEQPAAGPTKPQPAEGR
ncbi:sensor histidine kinase [Halomonas mongoliensis]|uniref:sensor histidine kinase n=1 Tax=Halomonas mongoliensis TaxID=321265 RepID=UPI00403AD1B4